MEQWSEDGRTSNTDPIGWFGQPNDAVDSNANLQGMGMAQQGMEANIITMMEKIMGMEEEAELPKKEGQDQPAMEVEMDLVKEAAERWRGHPRSTEADD
jgi:hypothetical protein